MFLSLGSVKFQGPGLLRLTVSPRRGICVGWGRAVGLRIFKVIDTRRLFLVLRRRRHSDPYQIRFSQSVVLMRTYSSQVAPIRLLGSMRHVALSRCFPRLYTITF